MDAVACDLLVAAIRCPQSPMRISCLTSLQTAPSASKKGDTATAKKVAEALKKLYKDGTVEQIAAKYADQGLTMDNWQIK